MTEMQAATCRIISKMSDESLQQALYIIMEDDLCYETAKNAPGMIEMLYAET